ncbi:RNA polymerase sigma factor [Bacillus fonticola]|uniref:RNA polymerase sigma factor n=1 Tax=Bacillus fonticola TaxID=2728853 RepID=UPI0014757F5E|nr:sigma-70 family RNA polymerase sigma factor [Bacillus fonticola]
MTDIELYQLVVQRDQDALERLYTQYEKLLFSLAFRVCQDRSLAEEAVQEVFMKLWTKPGLYDPTKGKFSSWLLTVQRHTAIDLIRKRSDKEFTLDARDDAQDPEPSAEQLAEWKERKEEIQQAVSALSQEQQEVIELFYFKGFTQREISERMGLPLGTVKGRLRLALNHLQQGMQAYRERGTEV